MAIESLVDFARRKIQEKIITGHIAPGQKIKEEEIAGELDISRPPVREAFKLLEAQGIVVRKPRRGVFVPEITRKDVWEIYTLKATLYEMSIALAMDNITDEGIAKLNDLSEKMAACVENDSLDLLSYQRFHRAFHRTIMDIAGNDRLKEFAGNLHHQASRFSYITLQNRAHLQSSIEYHRKILSAVKDKDKVLASRLMKEHVLKALDLQVEMSRLKASAES